MPVHLCKLASCETTTCSSLVRWQSSSSMSVPRSTALQRRRQKDGWLKMSGRDVLKSSTFTSVVTEFASEMQTVEGSTHKEIPLHIHPHTHTLTTVTGSRHTHLRHDPEKTKSSDVSTHCLKAAMVFSRFSPAPAK